MNKRELNSVKDFLYETCNDTRKITLTGFKNIGLIKYKEDGSPVTKFDIQAEDFIIDKILNKFPDHNILSEENDSSNKSSNYTWLIDPIDGTKSYAIGRPLWGTMIALLYKNNPIISILDFPCLDEIWLSDNNICYFNKIKFNLKKKMNISLENSICASTDPDLFDKKNYSKFLNFKKLVKHNVWSGDCHNYILLINGGVDIVLEENLSCYDIFPIIPILKSQNIYISDWQGNDLNFSFDKKIKYNVIACTDIKIRNELIKILQ